MLRVLRDSNGLSLVSTSDATVPEPRFDDVECICLNVLEQVHYHVKVGGSQTSSITQVPQNLLDHTGPPDRLDHTGRRVDRGLEPFSVSPFSFGRQLCQVAADVVLTSLRPPTFTSQLTPFEPAAGTLAPRVAVSSPSGPTTPPLQSSTAAPSGACDVLTIVTQGRDMCLENPDPEREVWVDCNSTCVNELAQLTTRHGCCFTDVWRARLAPGPNSIYSLYRLCDIADPCPCDDAAVVREVEQMCTTMPSPLTNNWQFCNQQCSAQIGALSEQYDCCLLQASWLAG